MSAFNLGAEEAAAPAGGAGEGAAAYSSSSVNAELFAPMPTASMGVAMPYKGGMDYGTPKIEVFLGYSYLRAVPTMAAGNRLVWLNGGSVSVAYNLNRYLGIVADVGDYTNSEIRFTDGYTGTVDVDASNGGVISYLFGPRLSFRHQGRLTPFVQVLAGGVHASEIDLANCTFSCTLLPKENTFAMTAGGGLDLRVHRHFAVRLIQAEYMMTRFTDYSTGVAGTQNDVRLSTGLVFRFGGGARMPELPPVDYSCSVNPRSVFPGDSIAVSGTAVNLDPAKTAVYTWTVDGGTVTGGSSSTAKIDTTNLAVGAYTLKGHVSEGSRPGENADCTAQYAVKAYEPPTVSCSANPVTVLSGDSSTITAIGVSPEDRPLTYSFATDSGAVSGSGATATLTTTGAAAGTATVTCNVVDDKGQSASATTPVTITIPAAAPKPVTSALCSVQFGRDVRRPSRVDNEAKACLDEIALNMQRNSDAKLAIVGNAQSGEKRGAKLAAERAANTKAYLVSDKGIDASRIAIYTGTANEATAASTLIPAGATLDTAGDTPVE
jgi:outer membrane protein OmpA-like peptidoglycan-associated protein